MREFGTDPTKRLTAITESEAINNIAPSNATHHSLPDTNTEQQHIVVITASYSTIIQISPAATCGMTASPITIAATTGRPTSGARRRLHSAHNTNDVANSRCATAKLVSCNTNTPLPPKKSPRADSANAAVAV